MGTLTVEATPKKNGTGDYEIAAKFRIFGKEYSSKPIDTVGPPSEDELRFIAHKMQGAIENYLLGTMQSSR